MSEGRDDVDSKTNEERTDSRVDGAKEREDNGQKPNGNDHRQSSRRPFA